VFDVVNGVVFESFAGFDALMVLMGLICLQV